MEFFWSGFKQALALLFPLNRDLLEIIRLSLAVSGSATLLSGLFAVPCGVVLALARFRGRRVVIALLNTMLAIPAVLIGLLVYMLVNRRGLLGPLGMLFTPAAMVLAQALLAFPIITALVLAALQGPAREARDLAYSLGASRLRMAVTVVRQGRFAFLTALIAGFSRIVGETGMTLMVGGNIKGETRVMTTAISLETMKGNFELGIALGLVLLAVALLLNILLQLLQGQGNR